LLILKKVSAESAEGKWFPYSDGIEIKIRPMTGQVMRDLRKSASTTKMEADPLSRKLVAVDRIDEAKLEDILNEYLIEDFRGIGSDSETALEVNLDSKKLIMDQIPLREFIWSCAQSLDIEGAQIKN
jgi:hypothetical protein